MDNKNQQSKQKTSLEEMCINLYPFVVNCCTSFNMNGTAYREDLIQEGQLAICEHYDEYDANIAEATTFFRPHILHRMQEFINGSVFNTTGHYSKNMKLISKAEDRLHECGIIHPTAEQIHIETDYKVSLVTIRACQDIKICNKSISINDTDTFTDDFYKNSSLTTISPENICVKKTETDGLKSGLARLSPIEQKCIRSKYGFETDETKSYRKIAEEEGLTPDKVRRIINTAINKLKDDCDLKHIYHTELKNRQKAQHRGEIGFGSAKNALPIMNALDDIFGITDDKNLKDINTKKRKKSTPKNKDNDFFL